MTRNICYSCTRSYTFRCTFKFRISLRSALYAAPKKVYVHFSTKTMLRCNIILEHLRVSKIWARGNCRCKENFDGAPQLWPGHPHHTGRPHLAPGREWATCLMKRSGQAVGRELAQRGKPDRPWDAALHNPLAPTPSHMDVPKIDVTQFRKSATSICTYKVHILGMLHNSQKV